MANYLLKISSTGNRFLIADNRWFNSSSPRKWDNQTFKIKYSFSDFLQLSEQNLPYRKSFIKELISHKELSLTDGLIVLKDSQKFLFECDFYNKDGSTAEMCGNAACCLSFYASYLSLPQGDFLLEKQQVSRTTEEGVSFNQKPVYIGDYNFSFNDKQYSFTLINSGVPHAVLECPLQESIHFKNKSLLKTIAKHLRFKNPKDKKGMNISFFEVEAENRLKAITYERGVEDWTLACGTGALALAFYYFHKKQAPNSNKILVNMPGGELQVQIEPKVELFSSVKKSH